MSKIVQTLFVALVLTGLHLTSADEGPKLPTIGLAIPVDPATDAPFQRAFRDGLRDLGYVDGKNVTLIVRYANGDPAKLRANIRELIALRVDVLTGDAPTLKEATSTIPIVSSLKTFKRVAYFIDRVVKGARPNDLPVEQPSELELVVNLKTAKALNLMVPQSILLRADEAIR